MQAKQRHQKHFSLRVVVLVACCATLLAPSVAKETRSRRWHTSLQQAMQEARNLNKPVIIHFYADWCGPCRRMDRAVLHSPELLNQFGTRFVGLKINSDHNRQLADRLGIRSLPTDVFIHPDGWMIQKSSGYKGKRDYFRKLAQIETIFQQAERMSLTSNKAKNLHGPILIPFEKPKQSPFQQPGTNPSSQKLENPVVQQSPGRPTSEQKSGQGSNRKVYRQPDKLKLSKPKAATTGRIIGLSAFSPVTLRDERKWSKGSRSYSETYQGITYYMRTETEARRFRNTPELYVPQYLGCDPVLLKEKQQMVPGSTRYAAVYGNRLYLFAKPEYRQHFRKTPKKYLNIKHQFSLSDIVK